MALYMSSLGVVLAQSMGGCSVVRRRTCALISTLGLDNRIP